MYVVPRLPNLYKKNKTMVGIRCWYGVPVDYVIMRALNDVATAFNSARFP